MSAHTRVSGKGQVVIPKRVRDRMRLTPGCVLDVIETPDGVLLRPCTQREGIGVDEAIRRIGEVLRYEGPPVSIEEMNESISRMWASGGPNNW